MNAEKYNLDRIYFGGCFIRGTYACGVELESTVDMDVRACCYNHHIIVCYPFLEQGNEACFVFAS